MDVFWRMTMSKIEVRLNDFVAEEIGVPEKKTIVSLHVPDKRDHIKCIESSSQMIITENDKTKHTIIVR